MGTEGNWGQPIVALTAFFLAIVILVLALRIFTRVWIVHAFWWDDFTIILAVVRSIPSSITVQYRLLIRLLSAARHNNWRRPGLCRSPLWLWQASALPHPLRSAAIQEVHIRRMDSDIRHPHVD